MKNGNIKQTGGALQLCNTTVFMMGGQANGCVPGYTPTVPDAAPAPTQTPCTAARAPARSCRPAGTWTGRRPNRWDEMTGANGQPDPTKTP